MSDKTVNERVWDLEYELGVLRGLIKLLSERLGRFEVALTTCIPAVKPVDEPVDEEFKKMVEDYCNGVLTPAMQRLAAGVPKEVIKWKRHRKSKGTAKRKLSKGIQKKQGSNA